jgi:hypothetical protein
MDGLDSTRSSFPEGLHGVVLQFGERRAHANAQRGTFCHVTSCTTKAGCSQASPWQFWAAHVHTSPSGFSPRLAWVSSERVLEGQAAGMRR